MSATDAIKLLLIADSLVSKILEQIKNAKDLSEADEAQLREALATIRARNDATFVEIDAILAARAAG